MASKKPGDPPDPAAAQATLENLSPVETHPTLRPVGPTMTLDEVDKPEPSATQLLDPVEEDIKTDPRQKIPPRPTGAHKLDVSADAPSSLARRRAALKSDAFESFPSLAESPENSPAREPRGPPPDWKKTSVWTPGLVAMMAMAVAFLLVALLLLLRG